MEVRGEFPQTPAETLAVIIKAERARKFVWTAGRVLIEAALTGQWSELDAQQKKIVLKGITKTLEALATDGLLLHRPDLQGIGFGQEKGFDYVHPVDTIRTAITHSS